MADLPEDPIWHEGIYQLEKTDPLSGGAEINPSTKQGISNWPLKQLAERTKWLRKEFEESVVIDPLEVSVGTGPSADFESVTAACQELSKLRAGFVPSGFAAEITILSGDAIEEQLLVSGIDLGWITLRSEDAIVPIVRSALTEEIEGARPAFYGTLGATMPVLSLDMEMDSSGSASQATGLNLTRSARATFAYGRMLRNSGHRNINITGGSQVYAHGCDLTGAGVEGVRATSASILTIRYADLRTGESDGPSDIVVETGGIINARNTSGGTNITPNEVTSNGIIFK